METMIPQFPSRMGRLTVILAISAEVAACASERPRERFHHRGPGGEGRGGAAQLFISPAGKPFRAAPDQPYPVVQWFAAADTDHDGKLTREEFRQDAAAFFNELDINHDGVIDGPEVARYEHVVAPEILGLVPDRSAGQASGAGEGGEGHRGGMGGRGGGRRGGGGQSGGRTTPGAVPQGAGLYGLINQPEPVAAADANFDGRITLAEFLEAADRHFATLDTADAGFLTLAGLPQTPAQALRARHRPDHDQD
jgi:hypothetical protein